MITGMILTEPQKAFNTIVHGMLLHKLYAIGFLKYTAKWFKSYLSKRPFQLNLGNNFFQATSLS